MLVAGNQTQDLTHARQSLYLEPLRLTFDVHLSFVVAAAFRIFADRVMIYKHWLLIVSSSPV